MIIDLRLIVLCGMTNFMEDSGLVIMHETDLGKFLGISRDSLRNTLSRLKSENLIRQIKTYYPLYRITNKGWNFLEMNRERLDFFSQLCKSAVVMIDGYNEDAPYYEEMYLNITEETK